jgi:23S rRNA-/tRNA-specific pseudouridylate synthase
LRGAFSEHRVEKVYRAIVHGTLEAERQLDLQVRVAQHKPAKVRVLEPGREHPDARPISMGVRPLEALRDATLVEVVPKTGFLHQIRVAMAHLGHPLLGDRVYGDARDEADAARAARRHMLHATAVRFEEVEAECEVAGDFCELLSSLRHDPA